MSKNEKNARAKRAKLLFFIVKYANLRGSCCRRRQLQRKSRLKIERCVKLSLIPCCSHYTK